MRLLVIEDDLTVARFLRQGLQEARYDVDWAGDGAAGVSLAQQISYDTIILDVVLPKYNGFAVCRTLRAQGNANPILLLSVRGSTEDKVFGLDCGADDYLTKPFAFAELLARLCALLRRRGPAHGDYVRVGDLRLDPVARRVWRRDTEIELTKKEFALLEYLMRNKDQPLTRLAIVEHVWEKPYDAMPNIVDAHIHALRTKLDRGFSFSLIQTVRGVGYVLRSPDRKRLDEDTDK